MDEGRQPGTERGAERGRRAQAGPARGSGRARQGSQGALSNFVAMAAHTGSAAPPSGRWWAAFGKDETRWAFVFLLPWIAGFLVFPAGPMVASLVLSLPSYDVINPPTFVGLDNYQEMLRDPDVTKSLYNTFYYTLLHVPLAMLIALGL